MEANWSIYVVMLVSRELSCDWSVIWGGRGRCRKALIWFPQAWAAVQAVRNSFEEKLVKAARQWEIRVDIDTRMGNNLQKEWHARMKSVWRALQWEGPVQEFEMSGPEPHFVLASQLLRSSWQPLHSIPSNKLVSLFCPDELLQSS